MTYRVINSATGERIRVEADSRVAAMAMLEGATNAHEYVDSSTVGAARPLMKGNTWKPAPVCSSCQHRHSPHNRCMHFEATTGYCKCSSEQFVGKQ